MEKALTNVEKIFEEVSNLGISVYKNYLDRKTWLLVEFGYVSIEISCGDSEIVVFHKVNDKTIADKVYKKAGWLVKYIKNEFEKELSKVRG